MARREVAQSRLNEARAIVAGVPTEGPFSMRASGAMFGYPSMRVRDPSPTSG
jgi:hypothetical protein